MTDFGRLPAGVRLDLVLPCLDEAGALPGVLAALPVGFRAIVVDNGSRDGSAEIARSLGAVVSTSLVAATAPPSMPVCSPPTPSTSP